MAPTVSFCTTCMGRLHHVKETLPRSLAQVADDPNVEFVLLDYNSPDELESWVMNHMQEALASGRLKYYRYPHAEYFQRAHAKNIAHKLATGDILCNVDCDTFVGDGYAELLRHAIPEPGMFISPGNCGQYSGRIAMWRADFWRLGGYNEEFTTGWGCEDVDLVNRAVEMGLKRCKVYITQVPGIGNILHIKDSSEQLNLIPQKVRSLAIQQKIRDWNMDHKLFIANQGYSWGAAHVFDHEGCERLVA